MVTRDDILTALEDVKDPEIPAISIVDLGMIADVQISPENSVVVILTPTFAGCPAIDVLRQGIHERVSQLPVNAVEVRVSFEIPWNSNRITERGRKILKDIGFAPPPKHDGYIELNVLSDIACPYCDSRNTTLQSPFGPTLCRAIHYCNDCSQAFEQFKPVA